MRTDIISRNGSIPTCVGQPRSVSPQRGWLPVYPHVCGATRSGVFKRAFRAGLSPRVWGNLLLLTRTLFWRGSIPTCVGQPWHASPVQIVDTVYPHVCGATPPAVPADVHAAGLSPRVWGNPPTLQLQVQRRRSIPTCVGQPASSTERGAAARVYPHVCGATRHKTQFWAYWSGLSPRVWGNPADRERPSRPGRSIPTCVGQPSRAGERMRRLWVYPHVCGATLP